MSTLQTITSTETLNPISLSKINTNFDTLNTDKAEKSGGTFTGDITVPDEAYGAGWNGSTEVPTKNAVYDKIESMPELSDGDKGDITVSSGGTVWAIDNDVVTNAKLANMASGTFKGRTTVGTGDPEDMTATQATALLDLATTSTKGLMSPSDKTKLDGLSNEWTLLKNNSFTAGSTYDSGTLATYDIYKIEYVGTQTGATTINMRINNVTSGSYNYLWRATNGSQTATTSDTKIQLYTSALGSGYVARGIYEIERAKNTLFGNGCGPFNTSSNSIILQYAHIATSSLTSIQLSTITNISGTIKIYGRNY